MLCRGDNKRDQYIPLPDTNLSYVNYHQPLFMVFRKYLARRSQDLYEHYLNFSHNDYSGYTLDPLDIRE